MAGRFLRSPLFRRLYLSYAGIVLLTIVLLAMVARERLEGLDAVFLVAAGCGAILALVLGLLVTRRVTRPIQEMTAVAEAMEAGDYSRKIRVRSRDEVGRLAETLNRLGEELDERIATIDRDRAQLRAMVRGMVEGVIALDESDGILLFNEAAAEFLDARVADPVGRKFWEVARHADLTQILREARRGPQRREIRLHGPGEPTVVQVHATPFEGGDVRGVVAVLHDISEIRRLEEVRRDFVANVSHELKTPLTSIRGYVETLLGGASREPEQTERFLRKIQGSTERLGRLVGELLDLARIEATEEPLPGTDVDVLLTLRETLRRHEVAMSRKQLTASVESANGVVARADPEALRQVLDNLVDNAIKYTPAGGRVTLQAARAGHHVRIEVIDTGVGIPPGDRKRVFERFYRVDRGRTPDTGGAGLGLSIVNHLVQRMNGEIRVESIPGKGSRFCVSLPAGD